MRTIRGPKRLWGAPGGVPSEPESLLDRSREPFEPLRATKVVRGSTIERPEEAPGSILGRFRMANVQNPSRLPVETHMRPKSTFSLLGLIWGGFWWFREPCWRSRGPFWPPRAALGSSRGAPGRSPGAPWALFWRSRGAPGALLGAPGGHLGTPGGPRALRTSIFNNPSTLFWLRHAQNWRFEHMDSKSAAQAQWFVKAKSPECRRERSRQQSCCTGAVFRKSEVPRMQARALSAAILLHRRNVL